MSFEPVPMNPDTISPELPLLLIYDTEGQTYTGQTGGVSCNHPEATGLLFNLRKAWKLKAYLDGEHHYQWCGYIDKEGMVALNQYFVAHTLPLRACGQYADEGWVEVTVQDVTHYGEKWSYLEPYIGRSGILIWNNCD